MKFWHIKAKYKKPDGSFFTMLHHCVDSKKEGAYLFFMTRIYPDDMKVLNLHTLVKVEIAESVSWIGDIFNLLVVQTLKSDIKEDLKYEEVYSLEFKEVSDENLVEINDCINNVSARFAYELSKTLGASKAAQVYKGVSHLIGELDEAKISEMFNKSGVYMRENFENKRDIIERFFHDSLPKDK